MVILDIDMPKYCGYCPLLYEYDSGFTYECPLLMEKFAGSLICRDVKKTMWEKREDDCPLIEGDVEMKKWINVEDALPAKKGQKCWLWSDEWTDEDEPELDIWEDDRGEPAEWGNGPSEDRKFIRSGWQTCTGIHITHWMPLNTPNPPKS